MAKRGTRKAKTEASDGPKADGDLGVDHILEQLEGVVSELEDGQLPLEEALARFERGVALVRRGEALLGGIEQRVERLLGDGDEVLPFDVDEEA